ncbi:NAD(P)H-binding protein [Streptomyces boluensis]|uniref:NAD(P)H-binding protein n=1 Tax=Streptomyces boluensis TaxID=1775135 RepID=A0A964UN59_9ACTN|nr:NAD(P)H-binding protein [Streptomyces boluensis]NBE49997.1 NAD(P)H-binding protein [Streptomyces boluensis]
MADRILVLGATGKTGRHVTDALHAADVPHRVGVRRPAASHAVPFDWHDRSTWAPALAGARAVYLVKPPVDPVAPITALLEQAGDLRHVVLLSEMGREGKPADDPERAVELIVQGGRWDWTILRPSWFLQNWGPGGAWGEQVRRTGEIVLPSGDARFSLVDARDVAEIAAAALNAGSGLGALTLTGRESVPLSELASRISAASGRPIRHVSPTLTESLARLRASGAPQAWVRYLADLEADAAAGVCAPIHDDLRRLLRREPRTVQEYVDENADFWARPVPS